MTRTNKPTTKPTLLVVSFLAATLAGHGVRAENAHPDAIQVLVERGVDIVDRFDAPGGMTGYVGTMRGRPVSFYLTSDKKHVVIGPMLSETGMNLTETNIRQSITGPQNEEAWSKLENSDWIPDGEEDAPVVIYTFTDPNCPYCHRFREAAEPWIEAGRVQLRHVMVGILKQDSLPKAATILGADNPESALHDNQRNHESGGIAVDREVVSANHKRVTANNSLMSNLGLSATPATFYKADDGTIAIKQGLPRPEELAAMMGSSQP
ncbi:thiol:disulfide interchange protein DsbG [Marinobacter sp.]|uniref:thiol:disulfide interchange protein DsbG n=1 Tax=Marinobacter sp. TaxID=50741 RepID=UPI00384E985B